MYLAVNHYLRQIAYGRTALSRREALSYAFLGALLLLLVIFAIVVFQMLVGRPEWVDLGVTDELQSEIERQQTPLLRLVPRGSDRVSIWLYYANGKWLAFDGRVPFGSRCFYEWTPLTRRFEDPCSGARFARTGEYLDIYTYLVGKPVQNLDQYPVEIRGNHLYADISHLLHAEPYYATAPSPECCR